jgi:hypothetical protein
MTLRCMPTYTRFQPDSVRHSVPKLPLSLGQRERSRLFLQIGWKDMEEKRLYSSKNTRAWKVVFEILMEHGRFRTDITISPYLGNDGDDHSCCFGKVPPPSICGPLPRITFQSDCTCRHGDVTKCKRNLKRCLFRYLSLLTSKYC